MSTGWIVAWLALMTAIGLNGFAAGVAAILYAWRISLLRESRIFLASVAAAALPTATLGALAIIGADSTDTSFGGMDVAIVAGAFLAVATVVSLPGAILVSRKLEAPGDEFRAFE